MSLKICIPAIAAFILVACSGDGNNAGDPDPSAEADLVVDSFDNLSVCIDDREGATAYVKDEEKDYICTNGGWTIDTTADARKKNSKDEVISSSSSAESSSSSKVGCKTETEDNCEYSELVDARDGQTYKTVRIGDQVWMAENLNNKVDSSWCGGRTDYNEGDCSKYGRFYTWAAAVGKSDEDCGYGKTCGLSGKVRGVCPEGWHLPDTTEWKKLFAVVGGQGIAGKALKSQTGWNWHNYEDKSGNGTDAYGFSAIPAGCRSYDGGFCSENDYAYFWSATEDDRIDAYGNKLDYTTVGAYFRNINKHDAFSVRCVQD